MNSSAPTQPILSSSWKDKINQLDDISRLAMNGAHANLHFARSKSAVDCLEAALADPTATFFVKIASSATPIIVQGLFECRSADASSSILKQHGIHHGKGNPADKYRINPENLFELFE